MLSAGGCKKDAGQSRAGPARGSRHLARAWQLVALIQCLPLSAACAQWSVDAAVERFDWREYTSPIQVRETGPRFAGGVGFSQPRKSGPLLAYRGRVYFGNVDYNGSFLFDTAQPAQGVSTYLGTAQAGELRYRWPAMLDAVAGLDYETWRRRLSASQSEEYRLLSLRLGAERLPGAASPWTASGGIRFLLGTGEIATTPIGNAVYRLSLSPGRGTSPFMSLGRRVGPRVILVGYWDSVRLGPSNQVAIGGSGTLMAYQPKSDMNLLGLRVVYRGLATR
jgi:hypothetical protein